MIHKYKICSKYFIQRKMAHVNITHTHSVDAPDSCWQVHGTLTEDSLDRMSPYLMITGTYLRKCSVNHSTLMVNVGEGPYQNLLLYLTLRTTSNQHLFTDTTPKL
jgi:hypothetical protein